MKNEKLTTGRLSASNNQNIKKELIGSINSEKDYPLITVDKGQIRPIIIGHTPRLGAHTPLQSRLNSEERIVASQDK